MQCQGCGHNNRDDAKFYESCGASLDKSCSSCGNALRLSARFCDSCGTPVETAADRGGPRAPSEGKQTRTSISEPASFAAGRFSDSVPSSFADGRYLVRKFLGDGVKKRVFLAHDELLDRDAALALIKTEGLDESLAISTELATRPLMERVPSRWEILKA